MPNKTERELRREVEDLRADRTTTAEGGDLSVEWRDADPEGRPTGMEYDPDEGTLAYDVWSTQRETLNALADIDLDIVAFLAGYGTGKSVTGARWLIAKALDHPGSRFLALGVDFTKARDATFRILFKQLPGDRTDVVTSSYNGPETSPIVADYNRAEHRLTLTNDTVIKLGSTDKWNRYAGNEYGAIWMDEPSHYGEDLHDLLEMMGSRLRGVDGPKKMLWTLTGNGYNAAWEILEKQEDADGDDLGLALELVRASTLENPYLDEATKERFQRQYADTSREEQALHGGFAAAQGLVYSAFRRDVHEIPPSEALDLVGDEWRVYGYDYGWNDPRVILEVGKTSYDQLVVLDEYHRRESHLEDAVAWLKQNDKPKGAIYCDHDPGDIEKLTKAGYQAKRAEKGIDEGVAEVRKRLEPDGNVSVSQSTGAKVVKGTPSEITNRLENDSNMEKVGMGRWKTTTSSTDGDTTPDREARVGLLVSSNCEHLIREFLGYKEEHVGKSQAVDHCLDSLRYLCMGVAGSDSVTVTRKSGVSPVKGKMRNSRREDRA